MTASSDDPTQDLQAQARRYWEAWSQSLQQGASGGAGPVPSASATAAGGAADWSQALGWWRGILGDSVPNDAQGAVDRASGQAADWLSLMQEVAGRFAGRDSSSAEVADAWRSAVKSHGDAMVHWVLGSLRGGEAGGFDPWLEQAAQLLGQWRSANAPWLDMPALGLGRNHHSRWQALARLQQEYQAQSQAYLQQLREALDKAFDRFEAKLAEHEAAGSQLTSARALFDLWIEAAEEAYAAIALSEDFREIYGAFANAHMRLRAALQGEVEQIASQYGMPTRSEMDAAHKRIAELERMVRRLAATVARGGEGGAPSRPSPRPAPRAPVTARPTKAAAPAKRAKAPAGKAPARQAAAKKPAAKAPAVKKAAPRKAAAKKTGRAAAARKAR